ncbi:hypothetical protein EGJ34_17545, partial [Stenotrophomonas sp. 278]
QTKDLFKRWLFYGIGTMFSMAVLAAALADPVSSTGDLIGGVSTTSRALGLETVRAQALAECSKQNGGGKCALFYSACSMSEYKAANQ